MKTRDEYIEAAARRIADHIGHGMTEKCEALAKVAVEPLLDEMELQTADNGACPYVVTSGGGTSYCRLAEDNGRPPYTHRLPEGWGKADAGGVEIEAEHLLSSFAAVNYELGFRDALKKPILQSDLNARETWRGQILQLLRHASPALPVEASYAESVIKHYYGMSATYFHQIHHEELCPSPLRKEFRTFPIAAQLSTTKES